jgi:hypothetical protein
MWVDPPRLLPSGHWSDSWGCKIWGDEAIVTIDGIAVSWRWQTEGCEWNAMQSSQECP